MAYSNRKFGGEFDNFGINAPFTPDLDSRTALWMNMEDRRSRSVKLDASGVPRISQIRNLCAIDGSVTEEPANIGTTTSSAPAAFDWGNGPALAWRSGLTTPGGHYRLLSDTTESGLMKSVEPFFFGITLAVNGSLSGLAASGILRLTNTSGASVADPKTIAVTVYDSSGDLIVAVSSEVWGTIQINTSSVSSGDKISIMLGYDGANRIAYLNGAEVYNSPYTDPEAAIWGDGYQLYFGANYSGNSFNTSGPDISIYNMCLGNGILNGTVSPTEPLRDRNSIPYWNAALMYAAGSESLLPNDSDFKNSRPITTWTP